MKYVNLKLHSDYSLLNGAAKIEEYIHLAKEKNINVLGLTDTNLYGAINFYTSCKNNGIKPIIGLEIYYDGLTINGLFSITLLAKNYEGYLDLIKLSNLGEKRLVNGLPKLELSDIIENSNNLYFIIGGNNSEIAKALDNFDYSSVIKIVKYFESHLNENVFFEISVSNIEKNILNTYLEILENKKYIFSNTTYYLKPEDYIKRDLLRAIKNIGTPNNDYFIESKNKDYYFKTDEDLDKFILVNEINIEITENAIKNIENILNNINIEIELGKLKFPKFSYDKNFSEYLELKNLCYKNFQIKYGENEKAKERLDYELDVIKKVSFENYFLIVQDIVNYAKKNGIYIGAGRGSASGSIISYLLNITEVDPIKYGLIFERFLNVERLSIPDIDIDIESERREEVINYIINKYGQENVFYINTFTKLKKKQAILDISKILKLIPAKQKKISDSLDNNLKTLKDELNSNYNIKKLYKDKEIKQVIDYAILIEGCIRQCSIHAAGIIISPKDNSNEIPICIDDTGRIKTQFEMTDLEKIGFVKMDMLSLINLSIIRNAIEIINNKKNINLSLKNLPLNDQKTYNLLSEGNTLGIFQSESKGMKNMYMNLKINSIEDISLALALYRPGPLKSGMSYEVINRKNGKSPITYIDSSIKELFYDTYGAIVYQEQVLQTLHLLAGFSMHEADILRRAMGKKIPEVLHKFRIKFVDKMIEKGYIKEKANHIYDMIETFGGYGFNKSHSTAYAFIVYYTAYLKANYPIEYMLSYLNYTKVNLETIKDELYRLGIKVHGIDINISIDKISIYDNTSIIIGFNQIKDIEEKTSKSIVNEREKNGNYLDFIDFIDRNLKNLSKLQIENLIYSGAFDKFDNKSTLIYNLNGIIESILNKKKNVENLKRGLFDELNNINDNYIIIKKREYDYKKLQTSEYKILGANISYSSDNICKNLQKVIELSKNTYIFDNLKYFNFILDKTNKIGGRVNNKEGIFGIIKNNIITNEIYPNERCYIKINTYINKIEYLVSIYSLSNDANIKMYILYDDLVLNKYLDIIEIFDKYKGINSVEFAIKDKNKIKRSKYKVKINEEFIEELSNIIGHKRIKIII